MKKAMLSACVVAVAVPGYATAGETSHGWHPPAATVGFLLALLGGIAVFPLISATRHWWESNRAKGTFVAALSIPMAALLLAYAPTQLMHVAVEYGQFVALLTSLYVVTGGVHVTGTFRPTPGMNVLLLMAGMAMASVVGTTGASMILLPLVLRVNAARARKAHVVVFLIIIVSNFGGMLTPLGDPPLYLGYLRGISFGWWAQKLWWVWVAGGAYLLAAFYVVDSVHYARERGTDDLVRADEESGPRERFGLMGGFNLPLLVAIVCASLFLSSPYREAVYLAAAGLSATYSRRNAGAREARIRNEYSNAPIVEVLVLFAGIFITMPAALSLLQTHGSALGLSKPWHYFLASGGFSSVLDNAPTFVIVLEGAMATEGGSSVRSFATLCPGILAAISMGAVFMGANTYVGNAPNLMVKAVAEARGVKMPNFFAYSFQAVLILSPVYAFVIFALPFIG